MKPLLLMILDGWGWRDEKDGNAIRLANDPNWNSYLKKWPHTLIDASGPAVGLPEGTMGNSEVGHLNMGAGRVVYQEFTRINLAIKDKSLFNNSVLKETFAKVKKLGSTLHLMGLASDIGVHSHLDHMYAILDFAVAEGLKKIHIHCFTDGRDSPPDSGLNYVKQVEAHGQKALKAAGGSSADIRIATVMGRYYAMDRDKRWDRIEKAYRAIVDGVGVKAETAEKAVRESYRAGKTDEFIVPTVIGTGSKMAGGDAVVFCNFRADRARQITRAIADKAFKEFQRNMPELSAFVTMTQYDENFILPTIFPPVRMTNLFGDVISKAGMRQLRIAETEKYAHVTYFFNGGEEKVFDGEDRALIPSPRDVPTYDKKPQMSAPQVADEVVKRVESGKYDVIILNFANPDMVGHTGVLSAAVKAVETVDACMGRVVDVVIKAGGAVLITGDHGNCEEMIDDRGEPQTAHTTDLVPFVVIGAGLEKARLRKKGGALCDIAPTMLKLLGLAQPKEMTGRSLIG
jgi:2,3-bisphosphoglycerate-independent phosphoglycerate mutase